MDPDKLLNDILTVAGEVADYEDDFGDQMVELCHNICNLDDWMMGGGFIPERWQSAKEA